MDTLCRSFLATDPPIFGRLGKFATSITFLETVFEVADSYGFKIQRPEIDSGNDLLKYQISKKLKL